MYSDSPSPKRKRLVRLREFCDRIGYGKTRVYDLIKEGKLPAPVRLPGGRAVAWDEAVVDALVDRIAAGEGVADA
jgi:prophage regulatory protein